MKTLTLIIGLAVSGCNLIVYPDGTRSWTLNMDAARAIIVRSTK